MFWQQLHPVVRGVAILFGLIVALQVLIAVAEAVLYIATTPIGWILACSILGMRMLVRWFQRNIKRI